MHSTVAFFTSFVLTVIFIFEIYIIAVSAEDLEEPTLKPHLGDETEKQASHPENELLAVRDDSSGLFRGRAEIKPCSYWSQNPDKCLEKKCAYIANDALCLDALPEQCNAFNGGMCGAGWEGQPCNGGEGGGGGGGGGGEGGGGEGGNLNCTSSDPTECPVANNCSQYSGNHCECKLSPHKCEDKWGTCTPSSTACADTDSAFENERDCGRIGFYPTFYYSDGGAFCKNTKARGVCEIAEVVQTINCNGNEHIDGMGIFYQGENNETESAVDPYGLRVLGPHGLNKSGYQFPKGVRPADHELFTAATFGNELNVSQNFKVRFGYKVPVITLGKYELAMMDGLCKDNEDANLFFHIEINYDTIIRNFNLWSYGDNCQALQFIVNFEVIEENGVKYIQLGPYPSKIPVEGDEIIVWFRYGGGGPDQCESSEGNHPHCTAFYVARFV